jgi:hypothetical protein
MKALHPLTLVIAGPVLFAVVLDSGAWLALPESRELGDIVWPLLVGAGLGLIIVTPVATLGTVKARHPEWLRQHGFRIHWYTSMAMGFSIGYFAACARNSFPDVLVLAAGAVTLLGAAVKIGLSDVFQRQI